MEATAAVTAETVKRGVITIRAGLYSNCVRFLPPLDITDAQLDEALEVVAGLGRPGCRGSSERESRGMNMDFRQFIGGEWTGAGNGGSWELINPATEEVIDLLPFGDGADAVAALDAAAAGFPGLEQHDSLSARERSSRRTAALIKSRAAEFAEITTAESGKPLDQAKGEWLSAPNYFLWAAEEAKRIYGRVIPSRLANRRIDVTYRPVGVVGLITAWNFPGLQPDPGDQFGPGGGLHDRLAAERVHAAVGDVDHVLPRGSRVCRRGSPTWSTGSHIRSVRSSSTIPAAARSASPVRPGSESC